MNDFLVNNGIKAEINKSYGAQYLQVRKYKNKNESAHQFRYFIFEGIIVIKISDKIEKLVCNKK